MTIIVGRTGSGKTVFARWVLGQMVRAGYFDYGIVFSATAHEGDWDCVPKKFIYTRYSEEAVKRILDYQKVHFPQDRRRCFMVFDDMLGDATYNSPLWETIASQGRHWGLTIIIISQRILKCIPPVIRENCHYAVFFRQDDDDLVKLIYKKYARRLVGRKGKFEDFLNWFDDNIHSRRALVCKCKYDGNDINEQFACKIAPANIPPYFLKFK